MPKEFQIAFWHPFGPHAGEKAEEIIERKRKEIEGNGWTLWSFQFRKTLGLWYEEIQRVSPDKVVVFCSMGKGSHDPVGTPQYCDYYIPVGESIPREIPDKIKVPHPMRRKGNGSAFIVKNIIFPINATAEGIEWLKDGKWQTAKLPTRPEYLIRKGKGVSKNQIRAILELQAPYLAEVGKRQYV